MKETITYECSKCGKRYVVSETGNGHYIPVYCCGVETKKSRKRKASGRKTKKVGSRK